MSVFNFHTQMVPNQKLDQLGVTNFIPMPDMPNPINEPAGYVGNGYKFVNFRAVSDNSITDTAGNNVKPTTGLKAIVPFLGGPGGSSASQPPVVEWVSRTNDSVIALLTSEDAITEHNNGEKSEFYVGYQANGSNYHIEMQNTADSGFGTLNTALTGTAETQIVVDYPFLAAGYPTAGVFYVKVNEGFYRRVFHTNATVAGTTLTLTLAAPVDFSRYSAAISNVCAGYPRLRRTRYRYDDGTNVSFFASKNPTTPTFISPFSNYAHEHNPGAVASANGTPPDSIGFFINGVSQHSVVMNPVQPLGKTGFQITVSSASSSSSDGTPSDIVIGGIADTITETLTGPLIDTHHSIRRNGPMGQMQRVNALNY